MMLSPSCFDVYIPNMKLRPTGVVVYQLLMAFSTYKIISVDASHLVAIGKVGLKFPSGSN
jgi:hypothetical protein